VLVRFWWKPRSMNVIASDMLVLRDWFPDRLRFTSFQYVRGLIGSLTEELAVPASNSFPNSDTNGALGPSLPRR
jgi:hypothetical protein